MNRDSKQPAAEPPARSGDQTLHQLFRKARREIAAQTPDFAAVWRHAAAAAAAEPSAVPAPHRHRLATVLGLGGIAAAAALMLAFWPPPPPDQPPVAPPASRPTTATTPGTPLWDWTPPSGALCAATDTARTTGDTAAGQDGTAAASFATWESPTAFLIDWIGG